MFLLISRFTVPPALLAEQTAAHHDWVRDHADAGHFVAGGPEVPYQGAVIAAVGVTRGELDGWLREDPFVMHGFVQYDVREYQVVLAAPGTEALAG
jgi:uncharacterized protein YciI